MSISVSGITVPSQLRHEKAYVCWRLEDGHPKPRKVPYYASGLRRHGKQGSPEDRAALVTFVEARAAAVKLGMDGIGLAFLPELGVVGIDFDHCIAANGDIPDEVAKIIFRAHAEISPSGDGIHAFLEGTLGDLRSAMGGDYAYGLDVFVTNGFLTITGNQIAGTLDYDQPLAGIDSFTRELCEARGATAPRLFDPKDFMAGHQPALVMTYAEIVDVLCKLDPSMPYNGGWRDVGFALHHQFHKGPPEGMGPDDGFELWNEWSSQSSEYPEGDGREVLRNFWDRFKTDATHPIRFATAIKMAKEMAARPEVQLQLRTALCPPEAVRARPSPEEAFSQPKALFDMADPVGALQSPAGYSGRFVITSVAATIAMAPMDWHMRGLIPLAELGMLYGASGVGKTFVAIDMMCHIACGMPWHGIPVRQGKVLYICAEGQRAVGHRIRAWCEHHGVDPRVLARNLAILNDAPNLCDAEHAAAVISAISAIGRIDLIVCDTLARMTAGHDENSAADMGIAIRHAQDIHKATGATIKLLHHPGKDISLGARGSSAIKAALDFELRLTSNSEGFREMKVTKMKDGESDMRYGLMLDKVVLAPRDNDAIDDETGEVIPLTSRVVRMVDIPTDPMVSDLMVLGENERFILSVFDGLPFGRNLYPVHELVKIIVDAAPPPLRDAQGVDLERDTRAFVYRAALDNLIKMKHRVRKEGQMAIIG